MAKNGRRRIVVIAKGKNHVGLLTPVVHALAERGYDLSLVSRRTGQKRQVVDLWADQGWECKRVRFLFAHLRRGDVFLCCTRSNDTNWFRRIMGAGSITRIALNEGGRFMRPGKYNDVDIFLGWGRSALELQGPKVEITGSVPYEEIRARPRGNSRPETAIINFKSIRKGDVMELEGAWLSEAVAAVRAVGMTPLISLHPGFWNMTKLAEQAEISEEPIADLLLECGALVTRGSTTMHHALAVGCQPFFFTDDTEFGAEYSTPMGAYPICQPGELEEKMRDWREGRAQYDPQPFLDHHFDYDPERPALERILDVIETEARRC